MPDFTAQDVKKLRDATGAGMMDAKRALQENDGDPTAAARWLAEKGLAATQKRSDRENAEGAIALGTAGDGKVAALVQLKSETDFVAKSDEFVKVAQQIADAVAADGEAAAERFTDQVNDLKVTLKENIELGQVVRFEAADGNELDAYLHVQAGRGVNGVLVELSGGSAELAHDVALHIAFAKPGTLSKDEVSQGDIDEQRSILETQTRNEGKPEQALPKIVEGKLGGWFKRVPGGSLLEQPYSRDEKQTVSQLLGGASVVRFAQVLIGA